MKKAAKTRKRSKKAGIKDLESKSNPKGGLNFAIDTPTAAAAFLKYDPIIKKV